MPREGGGGVVCTAPKGMVCQLILVDFSHFGHNSLRTGSLQERKNIWHAKLESGSEASGSRNVNPRVKRVGRGRARRHWF